MAVQEEIAESSPHLLSDFTPPFLGAPANSGLMRREEVGGYTPPTLILLFKLSIYTIRVLFVSGLSHYISGTIK